MRAARHEVIARTLRRRLGEHRRLKIDEAVRIKIAAHGTGDAVTQAQARAHDFAAQIKIAVFEAQLLVDGLIKLKRQRLAAIQNLDFLGEELDRAGGKIGVRGAARTGAHTAFDADHELIAQTLSFFENGGVLRIEHDLQEPLAIAQIHEDHPAVIAPAVHPAGDGHLFARQLLVDRAAVMATHIRLCVAQRRRA